MQRFLGDVNTERGMFLSLCTFGCGSQEVNSRKIHLQSTFGFFRRGGMNATKLGKKGEFIFPYRRHRRC